MNDVYENNSAAKDGRILHVHIVEGNPLCLSVSVCVCVSLSLSLSL